MGPAWIAVQDVLANCQERIVREDGLKVFYEQPVRAEPTLLSSGLLPRVSSPQCDERIMSVESAGNRYTPCCGRASTHARMAVNKEVWLSDTPKHQLFNLR
jgi:hypothetical protein